MTTGQIALKQPSNIIPRIYQDMPKRTSRVLIGKWDEYNELLVSKDGKVWLIFVTSQPHIQPSPSTMTTGQIALKQPSNIIPRIYQDMKGRGKD